MSKNFKLNKNDVNAEDLKKLGRTVEEINELVESIVNYCETCGTVNVITPSVREGRIYINITTKFNLPGLAYNLSERTGLKYRTIRKPRNNYFGYEKNGVIALLL